MRLANFRVDHCQQSFPDGGLGRIGGEGFLCDVGSADCDRAHAVFLRLQVCLHCRVGDASECGSFAQLRRSVFAPAVIILGVVSFVDYLLTLVLEFAKKQRCLVLVRFLRTRLA